mgnify:CR=1 FL=1
MDAPPLRKALAQRSGRLPCQNFVQLLPKQIAERHAPVRIEAARHDRPVAQHRDLVAQRAAAARPAPVLVRATSAPTAATNGTAETAKAAEE